MISPARGDEIKRSRAAAPGQRLCRRPAAACDQCGWLCEGVTTAAGSAARNTAAVRRIGILRPKFWLARRGDWEKDGQPDAGRQAAPKCAAKLFGRECDRLSPLRIRQNGIWLIPMLGGIIFPAMSISANQFIDAVQEGHVTQVARLLDQGADVNATNYGARTPLMEAAAYGHPRVVELLLARGANPNTEDNNGTTALMEAAAGGDDVTARLLRVAGASVAQCDHFGDAAIVYAQKQGHHRTADLLSREL